MAVCLDALEDLLPVVQNGCRGVERQRTVRLHARAVPPAADRPAHVDHVVGEGGAELRIGQHLGALGIALRVEVLRDGELEGASPASGS
jgi:hypothetical protein